MWPLFTRSGRSGREHDAVDGLAWSAAPPFALPAGVELEWLGTAGFRIPDEVGAVSRSFAVRTLRPLERIAG